MQPVDILSINIHAQRFQDAVATIMTWVERRESCYVCTCTVYTLMRAREQDAVRAALANAAMVTADGMPLVWLQRRWGARDAERVYGPDLMLALCARSAETPTRHYFLGGQAAIVDALIARLSAQFPTLVIAGRSSPLVEDAPTHIDERVAAQVRAAQPTIIWVGLGSPKQDVWMHLHKAAFPNAVMIGVGAAFDFLSGTLAQAPRWMQRAGLEWLFRLMQEPRRLAKRYLVYNPLFVWAVVTRSRRLFRKNSSRIDAG